MWWNAAVHYYNAILASMTDGFFIFWCDPAQFKSEFFLLANLSQALAETYINTAFSKFK